MSTPHYALGWLPAVLPADARRFRAGEPTLRAVLEDAGAVLVDVDPAVEIGSSAGELAGDADVAIVSIPAPPARARPLLARAGAKLGASARAVVAAERARRGLRRLGYPDVSVVRWDLRERTTLPGFPSPRRAFADRLPGAALVVGRRGDRGQTALEAALEAAGRAIGAALRPRWVAIRPGPVLVATDAGVLRVALGPSRAEIDGQVEALGALAAADASPRVADRVPWLLVEGKAGLARWSLERLRAGSPPAGLSAGILAECVDFLVDLGRIRGPAQPLADRAETIAAACRPDDAVRVRALAEALETDLADLPRGFGHGDFFAGNLLTTNGRLTGVLDWDAGGPGRLPLVDLLHLELTRAPYGGDERWGEAVRDRLLPLARAGGGETVRAYLRGAGLDLDPGTLERLVLAYWLEYAAYQLRVHPDRRGDRAWLDGNVRLVLEAAEVAATTTPAAARGALIRGA